MTEGTVFDIKQMALFDGPGIRTTVFLKGCPLRCRWCHNPEGLSPVPQLMVSISSCIGCGRCREVCPSPDRCIACGRCIKVCPLRLRRISGTRMTAEELAGKVLRDRDFLMSNGGGVTFSGGEPTMQPDFLMDCLDRLSGLHRAIETCGYCDSGIFSRIIERLEYVMMDIKLADSEEHRKYTGRDNGLILDNLRILKESGKPFRIRIPVIPGVNDDYRNFRMTAELVQGAEHLEKVELLPYHRTAGAKYEMVGLSYEPGFDEAAEPVLDTAAFEELGVPVSVM